MSSETLAPAIPWITGAALLNQGIGAAALFSAPIAIGAATVIDSVKARKAQENLDNERKAQLAAEARARAAEKEKMATTGQRAGGSTRQSFSTFQPAEQARTGFGNTLGKGNLFGN